MKAGRSAAEDETKKVKTDDLPVASEPSRRRDIQPINSSPLKQGVIVVGHGSRMEFNKSMVTDVAEALNAQKTFGPVIPAFLEFNEPDIRKAIEALAEKGIDMIYVQPCLLTNGTHLSKDIPKKLGISGGSGKIMIKNRPIQLRYCNPIGNDRRIAEILADRIRESMADDKA